jgi:hypothetical protein
MTFSEVFAKMTIEDWRFITSIAMSAMVIAMVFFIVAPILDLQKAELNDAKRDQQEEKRDREQFQNQTLIARDQAERDRQIQQEGVELAIRQNDQIIDALENATNLITEVINRSNIRGNATITGFNTLLAEVKEAILDNRAAIGQLIKQDANLTKQQQLELIANLEKIPDLSNQTAEMLNATNTMYNFTRFIANSFDQEYLIDEVRQYKISNDTRDLLPIINEKLDRIIGATNKSNSTSSESNGIR